MVADLRDEGRALCAFAWSPIPGDPRLAIGHERRGERAPAIWNVETGEVVDLPIPWDRLTEIACWWPDAKSAAPVRAPGRPELPPPVRPRDGRDQGACRCAPGSLTGARVRPDGSVWYRLQHGEQPGVVLQAGREEPVLVAPRPAPPGRPFVPWAFPNEHGDRVQGWLVEPDGPKPWPTLFFIHGGPTSVDLDRWSPEVQAYVDAGLRGGAAQLPRLDRLRRRLARRAHRQHRLAGGLGHRRGPRGPAREGHRRSGAIGHRRLVVGRLPDAADARHASRAVHQRRRGRARSPTTSPPTRTSRRSCRPTTGRCSAATRRTRATSSTSARR